MDDKEIGDHTMPREWETAVINEQNDQEEPFERAGNKRKDGLCGITWL